MKITVEKYIGCLLGVGIGDALGYPVEGLSPVEIKEQFGEGIKKYEQRKTRLDLKPGTVTDDTQLTLCIGESIAQYKSINAEDIAHRFVKWLDYGIGKGATCIKAIENLKKGIHWQNSGLYSAGNGSAMRVAPIGLFYYKNIKALVEACKITSTITHTDPRAIAGAIAVARGVALCLTAKGSINVKHFIYDLVKLTKPVSNEFSERINSLQDYMSMDALIALDKIRTGGFVMESVPAAIYAFLKFNNSFKDAVLVSVNAGYDADSVAAMAGSLAGAYLGVAAIPPEWIEGLQEFYKNKLIETATKLYGISN